MHKFLIAAMAFATLSVAASARAEVVDAQPSGFGGWGAGPAWGAA